MIISCEKELLMEGLNLVGRTVSNRTTLPILECILLSADDSGGTSGLCLTANDLEMSIKTAEISAEIEEPGSVALDARLFTEIVRKMPGDRIYIKTDGNNLTECVSGKARFNISGMPGEEFPAMPPIEKQETYTLKARTLKDMIRQTIFSVAIEETKPVLTGELLQYKDGFLSVVAVDGFRISYRRAAISSESEEQTMSAVVPAKALSELSRILPSDSDGEVSFFFTDKRVIFECSAFTFVSRLLEGDFIRYDQIFSEDFLTIVTADKLQLLTGLERACLIARDNKKSPVKLEIQEDSVIITSNTEMGKSYDEISCDIDGKNLEIAFNPRYLIEALRAIDDERVALRLTTSLGPCIIRGLEDDSYKYLILPLRLRS
ncbi:MAG: DNA polymerase III subunit beta [Clostridiales bacterium]|jgi:DNA polymerase-3 subunit beta|nr:DNA polymerase III subunit beta [Clostridiales bacterium]